jgi:hypothetical protein
MRILALEFEKLKILTFFAPIRTGKVPALPYESMQTSVFPARKIPAVGYSPPAWSNSVSCDPSTRGVRQGASIVPEFPSSPFGAT